MEAWKEDFIAGLRAGKSEAYLAKSLAGQPLSFVQGQRDTDIEFAQMWDEAKLTTGRDPKRELTPNTLEALLWAQCDDEEAAAYFGLKTAEFKKRIAASQELQNVYDTAPLGGKAALKRAQYEAALDGDKTMQTWMGKQYLGQSDKVDHKNSSSVPSGSVTINQIFLKTLTTEQLETLAAEAQGLPAIEMEKVEVKE